MCGIAGFTFKIKSESSSIILQKMIDTLEYRGPDDSNFFVTNNIALAHTRLSIIDLSGGKQPRLDTASGNMLVFNGEIYGYKKIAKELLNQGVHLKDASDTEVLFQLLQLNTIDKVLEVIDGMFAFAYYERHTNNIYLARDRFGEKPLFYGFVNNELVFGSQVSTVKQHPNFKNLGLDKAAISQYLALQYIPGERSGFNNINKIPSGSYLKFNNSCLSLHKYWQPKIGRFKKSPMDRLTRLEELLSESVKERLIADVPIGVFLSGGLDSSLIASIAAKHNPNIKAFSIAMNDESHDESIYAAEVANHLRIPHKIIRFSNTDLIESFETVLSSIDEPLADSSLLPTFLLCKAAKSEVKVALGGDGADELFAGYPNFQARYLAPVMSLIPKVAGKFLRTFINFFPQQSNYMGLGFRLNQLSYGFGYPSDLQSNQWMSAFSELEQAKLWRGGVIEKHKQGYLEKETLFQLSNLDNLSGAERLQHLFLSGYLAEDLLPKIDRASMRYGIEVRSPYLSSKFAQYALDLPFQDKVRWSCTKYALKAIARNHLPSSIIQRKKHGFAPPLANMLRTSIRARVSSILFETPNICNDWFNEVEILRYWNEHQSGKRDHHRKIWALLVLFQITNKV